MRKKMKCEALQLLDGGEGPCGKQYGNAQHEVRAQSRLTPYPQLSQTYLSEGADAKKDECKALQLLDGAEGPCGKQYGNAQHEVRAQSQISPYPQPSQTCLSERCGCEKR
jgi:hypothetical protein